jgi:hypothetical protein
VIRALTSVLLVLAAASAAGRQPAAPQFRYQRPVQITTAGPQRLDVDVTLLAGGSPFRTASAGDRRIAVGGLSDLRLFTGDNVEVPYLLVWPPQMQPEWVQGRVLGVAATENANGEKTSGFEVDLGEAFVVDAIELVGMRAPFLKRFRLEGSGDRERWTLLTAEGTAFDLPSEGLSQTKLAFTPGAYRYLRVTWDDTNSGRVPPPPVVRARHVQAAAPPPPALRTPLVVERQPSEPRVSRFRIRLPGGRLPVVALELAVGGEYLMREARVVEARLTGRQAVPQQIGRTVLRRVVQDGIAADALRIPIQQPSDAQLELVVDDGDNPPLDLHGVTAELAELPWIYFEANPGTVTARYGDAALAAPRYDLEAARQDVASATTVAAVWGDAQARVEAAAAAPLPMPDTGGTIDVSGFQFARAIAAAPVGLVAVPLDAAALAHSAAGTRFSDVRVVDNAGRQVPYLLERRDGPIALDVRLEPRDPGVPTAARAGRTVYVVPLPYQAMPATKLTLETRARVFQREVTLAELVPASERERGSTHDAGGSPLGARGPGARAGAAGLRRAGAAARRSRPADRRGR